jgi:hypothetical protein
MQQPDGKVNETDSKNKDMYVKNVLIDLRHALDSKKIMREEAREHVCKLKELYATIPANEQDPVVIEAFRKIDENWQNWAIDRTQQKGRQFIPRPGGQFSRLFFNVDLGRDWEGPDVFSYGRFTLRSPPVETKSECERATTSMPPANTIACSTNTSKTSIFCGKCKNGPLYYYNGKDCWKCM